MKVNTITAERLTGTALTNLMIMKEGDVDEAVKFLRFAVSGIDNDTAALIRACLTAGWKAAQAVRVEA